MDKNYAQDLAGSDVLFLPSGINFGNIVCACRADGSCSYE